MLPILLTILLVAQAAIPPQVRVQGDCKPCEQVDGGSHVLTPEMKASLASRYRSWQVRMQCVGEARENAIDPKWASVASGDYDGDGRIDQAILLESKSSANRTIVVVFMSSVGSEPVLAGPGSQQMSTIPRGRRGHNYELDRDFTYESDAIFVGDYHCCGASLIWRTGNSSRSRPATSRKIGAQGRSTMRLAGAFVAVILATTGSTIAAGKSVLFIGNSFLFGSGSAVRFYRADTVTDLNNEGIGGVPALFKSFTQQAGLEYDVVARDARRQRPRFSSRRKVRRDRQQAVGHRGDARLQPARRAEAARSREARRDQQADGGFSPRQESRASRCS